MSLAALTVSPLPERRHGTDRRRVPRGGRRFTDWRGRAAQEPCDGCGSASSLQWMAAGKEFDEFCCRRCRCRVFAAHSRSSAWPLRGRAVMAYRLRPDRITRTIESRGISQPRRTAIRGRAPRRSRSALVGAHHLARVGKLGRAWFQWSIVGHWSGWMRFARRPALPTSGTQSRQWSSSAARPGGVW